MIFKQKVILSIWLFTLVVIGFTKHTALFKTCFILGLPLLVMGIGGYVYPKIKLPRTYWSIPLCVSLSLPLLIINPLKVEVHDFQFGLLLSIGLAALLQLMRIHELINVLKVSFLLDRLDLSDFIRKFIIMIWMLIGEEIMFRFYLFQSLHGFLSPLAILLLSSFLFVLFHFHNKFAVNLYNYKDYIFQFLLSLGLGYIYISTHSLFLCILGHFIYNIGGYITLVIQCPIYQKLKV